MTAEDSRHRPVVFQTHAEPGERQRRRPMRMLAGATLILVALAGATGLALGGSAVWSGVGPKVQNHTPAPLWPMPATPAPALAGHSTPATQTGPASGSGSTSHGGPTTGAAPTTEPSGDRHRGGSGTSGGGLTSGGSGSRGGSSGHG
ncbi:MAG TPA: hypothetical protein VH352_17605 [Pseudonocardiaceae bacterium]|jgi:hypothetical protein|nr:hypothetical protein [Pseudonocardiaceae bacterium]